MSGRKDETRVQYPSQQPFYDLDRQINHQPPPSVSKETDPGSRGGVFGLPSWVVTIRIERTPW